MNTKTKDIVKNLLGVESFTHMQETFEEASSAHDNVMLLSPTGTGKTFAYMLALIENITFTSDDVLALVIVPSRELAIQIESVFLRIKELCRVQACFGGRPAMDENKRIKELKPHVVITTPGRLLDHIDKGNISVDSVQAVVLDEFDKILELGFHDEMRTIFAKFSRQIQLILTSATPIEEVPSFIPFGKKGYTTLNFLGDASVKSRLSEYFVKSPEMDKLTTIGLLLTDFGSSSTIVFVNYRESVDRVYGYLLSHGFAAEQFHGGMEQEKRERAIFKFRSGSSNVLISTDLSARGLDISSVKHIVHYHLPINNEVYIHRTGRTGRWDVSGSSYVIINPKEELPEYITIASSEYVLQSSSIHSSKPRFTTLYIGRGKKDKISKADIVGFLCKKGGLRAYNIGNIEVRAMHSYVSVDSKHSTNALYEVRDEKLKGKKVKVEVMKNGR